MSWRQWLGAFAFVEIALILVAIRTGWRWHRVKPVRHFRAELRRRWLRVTVGATAGWLLSNAVGLALLVAAYQARHVQDTWTDYVVLLPVVGVILGGWAGYRTAARA